MPIDAHIVKSYTAEMEQLAAMISEMGGLAEAAVADAMQALRRNDSDLAEKVIAGDQKIDALEEQIGSFVVRLLALRQPMATDLRTIVSALKIAGDLERIGDYAKSISKRTIILSRSQVNGPVSGIANLSRMVELLLHDALNSYSAGDADTAKALRHRDQEIDDTHTSLFAKS